MYGGEGALDCGGKDQFRSTKKVFGVFSTDLLRNGGVISAALFLFRDCGDNAALKRISMSH